MSGYPLPPPAYTDNPKPSTSYGAADGADEPLLQAQQYASGAHALRNDWIGHADDDIPDDFKIGMTVSESAVEIRQAFIRKVYGVLSVQILATTAVGAIMSTPSVSFWVQQHTGFLFIPMIGSIIAMLGVYWKRYSYPLNLFLLAVFTALEAITLGAVVSFYNQAIVLQALIITTVVFIGLTLFTFQSKYDFSAMGTYLFAGSLMFITTLLVGFFVPYSQTLDMVIAGAGCLLFSGYIVYDTYLLMNKLHIDDWVLACVSLYLDIVNLFLNILRLLSNAQDN